MKGYFAIYYDKVKKQLNNYFDKSIIKIIGENENGKNLNY